MRERPHRHPSALPPRDTTAPAVALESPAPGAVGVAPTADVRVTFSEDVIGLTSSSFTLDGPSVAVAVDLTYDAADRVATLHPTTQLAAGRTCYVTLRNAVTDASWNPLPFSQWSFTTVAAPQKGTVRPTITARTPKVSATGVARGGNVMVSFSEPVTGVNGTTLTLRTSPGALVAATVRYDATTRVAALDPRPTLTALESYRVSLTSGINDGAGNQLAATSWSFTTGK